MTDSFIFKKDIGMRLQKQDAGLEIHKVKIKRLSNTQGFWNKFPVCVKKKKKYKKI